MTTYFEPADALTPQDHAEVVAVLQQARRMLQRYDRQRAALEGPYPLPALPLEALDAAARLELSCCFHAFWQLASHAAQLLYTHIDVGEYTALAACHTPHAVGFVEQRSFLYFDANEIALAHGALEFLTGAATATAPRNPVPGARVAIPLGRASSFDHLRARWRSALALAGSLFDPA